MKLLISIILIALLVVVGAEAKYSPGLEIASGSDITLADGGKITGSDVGTASNDLLTISQGWNKLNKSDPLLYQLPFVTVGFTAACNYVCDADHDEVQINQAIADHGNVYLMPGVYNIEDTIDITDNTWLVGGPSSVLNSTSLSEAIRVDFDVNNRTQSFHLNGFHLHDITDTSSSIGINIINTVEGSSSSIDGIYVHGFDKQIAFSGQGPWPYNSSTAIHNIHNCVIGQYTEIGRSYGVYIERAICVNIDSCRITGYEVAGIYGERLDSSHITNNAIISIANTCGGLTPDYGIRIISSDADQLAVDLHIEGNAIENTYASAIVIGGTMPLFDVFIRNNEINIYNNGIYFDATGTYADHDIFVESNSFGAARTGADGRPIYLQDVYHAQVNHNSIFTNGTTNGFAIRITSTNRASNSIIGNTIDSGTTNSNEGIYVGADRTTVMGNSFYGTGTVTNTIVIASGADNCTVIGNSGVIGKISNSGSNNVIDHNA